MAEMTAPENQIKWFSSKDIAEIFGVSVNTVRCWLVRKQMPQPDIQENRFTRWKYGTIKPFLDDPLAWRTNHKEVQA